MFKKLMLGMAVLAIVALGLMALDTPKADITYTDTYDGSHCHLVLMQDGANLIESQTCTNVLPIGGGFFAHETFTSSATIPNVTDFTTVGSHTYFGDQGATDGWIGSIFSYNSGYWQNVTTNDAWTNSCGGYYGEHTFTPVSYNGAVPTVDYDFGNYDSLLKNCPVPSFVQDPNHGIVWIIQGNDGGFCHLWIYDNGTPSPTNETQPGACGANFVGLPNPVSYVYGKVNGNPAFMDATGQIVYLPYRPPNAMRK